GEFRRKGIAVEGHEHLAAAPELGRQPRYFRFALACDKQRGCRRKGEGVLHGAVDAQDLVAGDRNGGTHHGTLPARPFRSVPFEVDHPRIGEQREVEGHRFFRLTVKHEEWRNRRRHGNSPDSGNSLDPLAAPRQARRQARQDDQPRRAPWLNARSRTWGGSRKSCIMCPSTWPTNGRCWPGSVP